MLFFLVRSKTIENQQKQKQQKSEQNEEEQQKQSIQVERNQPKRRGRKPKKQMQKKEAQQQQKIEALVLLGGQKDKQSKQKLQSSEEDQQLPHELKYRTRSGRNRKQVAYKQDESKESQNINNQEKSESDQQSENQQPIKIYPLRANKTKQITRNNAPKKRGRPKKVITQQNVHDQSEQQEAEQIMENQNSSLNEQEKQNEQLSKKDLKENINMSNNNVGRKTRNFISKIKNIAIQTKESDLPVDHDKDKNQIDEKLKYLILQRVRFCLNKRQQLIQYLDDLNVTTEIVKDILDLDVTSVILEQGQNSAQSIRVLHKLKNALLHKYFPEDIKIKKKYQKMYKKGQFVHSKSIQNEQSLQSLELRRKTIVKLQKILRSLDESADQRFKAVEIELFFRRFDESIGDDYKVMAYRVLRSLKDKNHTVDEVLSKLESGQFEQDQK